MPCFNPHPAFRPDATIKYAIKDPRYAILIRPAGCSRPSARPDGCWVSILIRPFDRMLLSQASNASNEFQSSSGLSTGCYKMNRMARALFNPHPAFRPDATAMLGFPT